MNGAVLHAQAAPDGGCSQLAPMPTPASVLMLDHQGHAQPWHWQHCGRGSKGQQTQEVPNRILAAQAGSRRERSVRYFTVGTAWGWVGQGPSVMLLAGHVLRIWLRPA